MSHANSTLYGHCANVQLETVYVILCLLSVVKCASCVSLFELINEINSYLNDCKSYWPMSDQSEHNSPTSRKEKNCHL